MRRNALPEDGVLFVPFNAVTRGVNMKLNYMYEMNTRQIRDVAQRTDIAFLPIGPAEVHSLHLPVGTDVESALDVCERAAAKLAAHGVETLIAPPVNYALADAVNCFFGNVTLRYETVVAVVEDICAGLGKWGFKHVILMCGHAEPRNTQALLEAADRAMKRDSSLHVELSDWLLGSDIGGLLQCEHPEWDIHAGESETALMLNRRPDLVDMEAGHLTYDPAGETYDDIYSNNILNRYVNQSAGLNFMYQKKNIRAQLGAAFRPTDTHNETNGESYDSRVFNWSPQAMLGYEINDNTNIRMFYFGRSSQPSTSQLMPVPDNSDPLNISLGNPELIPYFNHNLRTMFGYTDKETFMSIHARFGGSLVQDPIVNAQWYDSNGAQFSIPVNGPLSGSADGRVMINSPFGKDSKFSVFSMTNARYSESNSYIGKTGAFDTDRYYDSSTAEFDYDTFLDDFRNIGDQMFTENKTRSLNFTQRLRFTFRNEAVEVNIGGRTRVSKSWYTIASYNQKPTWNNQVDASVNWTIPGGVNLISSLDYNWYNGYTTPQEDEFVLNAEINKLLFKDKFTLALKAYDIFNQSKNLSVTDESNYHLETRNNTLGRYVILSLTYRFGNFNGPQGGGRGHGPMGPPPRRG